MNKQKIILDCDPGHDDAIAILLAVASPSIDLLGISVVAGNQTIEKTAQNALNVARFLNSNVPIAIGCSLPIIRDRIICSEVHGESGLDGFTFPKYEKNFDKRHACQMMIDLIMANDDVVVVTTGPMTNLAMAMRLEPKIVKRIKKVILLPLRNSILCVMLKLPILFLILVSMFICVVLISQEKFLFVMK